MGHDDKAGIYLDYDARQALGVEKEADLEFTCTEVKCLKKIWWYINTADPMIHTPARLAVFSVIVGIIGIAVGIYGICTAK